MKFVLDRESILSEDRILFNIPQEELNAYFDAIEEGINQCYAGQEITVVQSGRVLVLRATDAQRLSSAFKSAIYLGKYNDLNNRKRFMSKMVTAGHSYEPIRGENVLFLFIGVSKPVYDHLVTYTVGRPTRIAGGQRANLPWGFEVPCEIAESEREHYKELGVAAIDRVVDIVKGADEETAKAQLQAARSLLPVGYLMPPFLMEFTEEALAKTVFRQRIWETGAQGATAEVVQQMWECVLKIDTEKWLHLYDYHGPHTDAWERVMRALRDKSVPIETVLASHIEGETLYDTLMREYGRQPKSMWVKK